MRIIKAYLVLVMAGTINAEENFNFGFDLGTIGAGFDFPVTNDIQYGLSINVCNIFIEHNYTHIGIKLSPFEYHYKTTDDKKINETMSFINLNMYWNPFTIKNIRAGPVVSIKYLNLYKGNMIVDTILYNAGLFVSWYPIVLRNKIHAQLAGFEIGYKNRYDERAFYVTINFDLAFFLLHVLPYMVISPYPHD